MDVDVRLHGVFRRGRFKEERRTLPPGSSPRDVVEELQIPHHLLGIVVINDVHAQLDDVLHDGDTLALFPLLDGG